MNHILKASDYLDTKYREYSIYINNSRAIPSVYDGLKPVQRKTLFAAIKEAKNKFVKVSSLAGSVINIAAYHHGDASAQDAITKMAQDFNNNIPFLDQDGSFGTRLSPVASAGRYIFVKLAENFEDFFKDMELVPNSLDENDHPEPIYYLPVIPTVLLNGVSGVAVGFATNILPRSAKTLASECINYLKGKKVSEMIPYQEGFRGTITKVSDGVYECSGVIKFKGKTGIVIEELPLGMTHEKYQEHLIKLQDTGVINSFIDNSDSKFNFEISIPRTSTKSEEEWEKELKLSVRMNENIVVVGDLTQDVSETGIDMSSIAIRQYDSAENVLKDFVEFRLKYYFKRIDMNIARIAKLISENEDKIRFINDVLSKKIKIGEMTRSSLIEYMKGAKYNEEHITKVIGMSIYNMTKDNVEKLHNDIKELQEQKSYWESCDAKELYIKDLEVIKKKYN